MPTTTQTLKLPDYSSDLFVNRIDETELVLHKAKSLAKGELLAERTVIFIAQRGAGKTWLLKKLTEEIEQLEGARPLLINLDDYTNQPSEKTVIEILNKLNHELLAQTVTKIAKPADLSREFMQRIQPHLQKQPLVLLVDSVYESDWDMLADLEDYVLGPLAVESEVLIVMAGRGRPYPWRTPELRLNARFWDLETFTEEDTKEQIERQNKKAASRSAEIHQLSGGNPLANFWLATHSEPAAALDRAIEGILETVPEEKRHQLREHMEAISVLRSFDEERIPTMLSAYYNDPSYKDWTYRQVREVRESLVKWSFARWEETHGGYIIDTFIRKLLRRYLIKTDPITHKWRSLQCAANQLYRDWAKEYERTRERWNDEAEYHSAQLEREGFTLEDCTHYQDHSPAEEAAVQTRRDIS